MNKGYREKYNLILILTVLIKASCYLTAVQKSSWDRQQGLFEKESNPISMLRENTGHADRITNSICRSNIQSWSQTVHLQISLFYMHIALKIVTKLW